MASEARLLSICLPAWHPGGEQAALACGRIEAQRQLLVGPTMDCTCAPASTLSFSVRRNRMPTPTSETMMPLVPDNEQELAALAVDQHHADHGHEKFTHGEKHVAPVRLQVGEPALQQNASVVADDGVDAGGCVAGENDAGEQKGNHVFALQQRVRECACRLGFCDLLRARASSISLNSRLGLLGAAGAQQGGVALCPFCRAEEPARRLADQQAADDKENAGRKRDPEDAAPCLFLNAKSVAASEAAATALHAIAVVHADQGCRHDAEGEQPLEDSGALAAARCARALGQVERNHHADESAADALQQAAKEQRPVAVRKGDDRNADDEGEAAENHQRLAAHPVGQQAGKERGEDAAQQHGRHDDGKLRGGRGARWLPGRDTRRR